MRFRLSLLAYSSNAQLPPSPPLPSPSLSSRVFLPCPTMRTLGCSPLPYMGLRLCLQVESTIQAEEAAIAAEEQRYLARKEVLETGEHVVCFCRFRCTAPPVGESFTFLHDILAFSKLLSSERKETWRQNAQCVRPFSSRFFGRKIPRFLPCQQ